MLRGPTELSAKLLSPMSVHHCPAEVVGVKVFGRCFSFEKFSGKLGRSKSQRLVTVPRHKCYQLGLKPSGRGKCAERAAALEPISALACNRELPRISLFLRLSEKGASDALSVDLAGIRRPKWAEKHRFGCP